MVRPEQLYLINQWIGKAEEDYKNAEYTLTLEQDCPVSTVCFHSQQCAEKYLKALLICHSLAVPKSHDRWSCTIGFRRTTGLLCRKRAWQS
jgi:hypothetical protein